jgi:N-acetylmuramoyl-L-alanine amidase
MAPSRDPETRDLIKRLHAERRRRKQRRLLLAGLGSVVLLAAVIAAVFAALSTGDDGAAGPGSSAVATTGPSSSAVAGTSPASRPPTTGGTTVSSMSPSSTGTSDTGTVTTVPTTPTTVPTTPTTVPTTPATGNPLMGKVVVIDPGHQAHANPELEPIGPGSSRRKAKVSGGTSGVVTHTPESELALAVGLKLRHALQARGITVIMTRMTQDVDISNIERARIANQAGADLFVRLHANGSPNQSVHGLFVLYPASIKGWTDDIAAASKEAATLVLRELIAATGAQDRGLQERSDLTGFNWSDVPVVLAEMGYMTNPAEDRLLATPAYEDKLVEGFVRAIVQFLERK